MKVMLTIKLKSFSKLNINKCVTICIRKYWNKIWHGDSLLKKVTDYRKLYCIVLKVACIILFFYAKFFMYCKQILFASYHV